MAWQEYVRAVKLGMAARRFKAMPMVRACKKCLWSDMALYMMGGSA